MSICKIWCFFKILEFRKKWKNRKKHKFCKYDKNHRNPKNTKNTKKVHFPKIPKNRYFKKNTLFFEIPKRGILGPPKKGVFWDPLKKGYFWDPLKKGYFGKNRVFFEYGVYWGFYLKGSVLNMLYFSELYLFIFNLLKINIFILSFKNSRF